MRQAMKDHAALMTVGLIYVAAMLVLAVAKGAPLSQLVMLPSCMFFYVICCFVFLCGLAGLFLVKAGKDAWHEPNGRFLKNLETHFDRRLGEYLATGKAAQGVAGAAALMMINALCIAKSLVGNMGHFRWDRALAHADAWLHFGRQPYDWLLPISTPAALAIADNAYLLWFAIVFTVGGYCLFCDGDRQRRARYLWTNMLSWIVLGTLGAMYFSSAGPIFFHVYHPDLTDPYGALKNHLAAVNAQMPLHVLDLIKLMQDMQANGQLINVNGISAMPSMHVGCAWMLVLYLRTVNRLMFILSLLFCMTIEAGSVALGWHYAIDGYAAIAGVTAIWWATRFIVRPRRAS